MDTRPKTKEEALQQLRFIWLAELVSVPLYLYIVHTVPGISSLRFRHAIGIFSAISFLDLVSFFWFWQKRLLPSVENMRSNPDDIHAINKWVQYAIILLSLAESHALFGVALNLGGKTLEQSAPFYVIAVVLLFLLWPQKVWASQTGDTMSNRPIQ